MKNVTKTNALFAFIVAFYILCSYIFALIPSGIVPSSLNQVLPQIIMMIPCVLYVFLMKPETVKDISYGAVSIGTILKVVVLTYLFMPLTMFINGLSSMFFRNEVSELMVEINKSPLWFKLATIAVIPAIVEEFVFRGLIFHGLKRRNPFWAVIISGFFFGMMHMNVNQFLYAFAMGICFALVAYATGSMWPTMLMHFIYNAQSVILSHILYKFAPEAMTAAADSTEVLAEVDTVALIVSYIMVYGTLLVIVAVCLFLAALLYMNICKKNRGAEGVKRIFAKPYRKQFDDSQGKFFDGYMVLAVVLCILIMIKTEIG